MQNLPIPTLDHVVINVRDQLDAAEDLYRRLGFHLTPRGHHTLGSMNHLAMFGTDYLELIAVPPGKTDRNDILAYPMGVNGVVFGTEDSDTLHGQLTAAGVPILPPNRFSRPVALPGGTRDAAFRTTRLDPAAVPAGRLYFCQHETRDLVWRDEWRRHPNGVTGVVSATIIAPARSVMRDLFTRMFGAASQQTIPGGTRLVTGLSSIDVITQDEAANRYGAALPDAGGRAEYMACLTLRCTALDQAEAALSAGDIPATRTDSRLLVSAADTMGATLEFIP